MQDWEEKVDGILAMMLSTMNVNMDKRVEATTNKLKVQASLWEQWLWSSNPQTNTYNYSTIFGCHLPSPPTHDHLTPMHNGGTIPQLQAPFRPSQLITNQQ